jgi:hypothetical protein
MAMQRGLIYMDRRWFIRTGALGQDHYESKEQMAPWLKVLASSRGLALNRFCIESPVLNCSRVVRVPRFVAKSRKLK